MKVSLIIVGDMHTIDNYVLESIANMTGVNNELYNMAYVFIKICSYISLHKELFGDYKGDLMQQPSKEVMQRVSGTFYEFLDREGLLVLAPIIELCQTSMGYGSLDEIGALYGLQWNTPRMIASFLAFINQIGDKEASMGIMRYGFGTIWRTIVEQEKLDVRYSTEVTSIERRAGGTVKLTLLNDRGDKVEACDFLVWATGVGDFFKKAKNFTTKEMELLGEKNSTTFTVSLVNYAKEAQYDTDCMNIHNIQQKNDHSVIAHASVENTLVQNNYIKRLVFVFLSSELIASC